MAPGPAAVALLGNLLEMQILSTPISTTADLTPQELWGWGLQARRGFLIHSQV